MSVINLENLVVEEMIEILRRIHADHARKVPVALEFKGDFLFTEAGESLRALMEQTRVLWFHASGFESSLLRHMKDSLADQDGEISRTIGWKE